MGVLFFRNKGSTVHLLPRNGVICFLSLPHMYPHRMIHKLLAMGQALASLLRKHLRRLPSRQSSIFFQESKSLLRLSETKKNDFHPKA